MNAQTQSNSSYNSKSKMCESLFLSLKRKYPEMESKGFTFNRISHIVTNSKINFTNKEKLSKLINVLENKIRSVSNPTQTINNTNKFKRDSLGGRSINMNTSVDKLNNLQYSDSQLQVGQSMPKRDMSGFISPEERVGMSQASQLFKKSMEMSLKNMDQQEEFFSASGNVPTNISMPKLLREVPRENNTDLKTDRFILRDREKELFSKERIEKEYYVVIDSKDRDTTQYVNPAEYIIHLSPPNYSASDSKTGFISRQFNNITSIELLECIFRDTSAESDASDNGNPPPYVLLEIEEVGGNYEGTNEYLNNAFAILSDYTVLGNYKYYNFVSNRTNTSRSIKIFNPRRSLSKITIRFRLPNGDLYSFGDAYNTNSNTVNKLVFKINVIQRNLRTQFLDKTDG